MHRQECKQYQTLNIQNPYGDMWFKPTSIPSVVCETLDTNRQVELKNELEKSYRFYFLKGKELATDRHV